MLLARAITVFLPFAFGLKAKLKGRNAKRPRSCPSAAGTQLLPPSVDTSTVRMPYPTSQAMPPTLTVEPALICKNWYSISRTVLDNHAHCGNADDCSVRAFAVKPRAF